MRRSSGWITVIAGLALLNSVILPIKAVQKFRHPAPAWMTIADQWYDDLIYAALAWIIFIACVGYAVRTTQERKRGNGSRSRRWKDKKELRFVLYGWASILIFQIPLGVFKSVRAMHSNPPPWQKTFWSGFELGWVLEAAVGVAVIAYDRRKLARDVHIQSTVCAQCGYDLRATPDRCPECGMVVVSRVSESGDHKS